MGFPNRVTPKRSLGQNFLINPGLIKKIITVVLNSDPKHITEIGPGKGAFTEEFYATTIPMILIEKDFNFTQILQDNYRGTQVHNIDFLDFELNNFNTTYFGSLPFNKSKDIIYKIISSPTFNNPAFFIIQKEVAEKYSSKNVNPLSLIREIYSNFEILFDIKAGNFRPKPNVTTSLVKFTPHRKSWNVNVKDLELLIKKSFKYPRKTLKNNLKSYNLSKEIAGKRPAQLLLSNYVSILKNS